MNKSRIVIFSILFGVTYCSPKEENQIINLVGYELTIPSSMHPTEGLNHRAILQFKDPIKMIYTFVTETTKEDLLRTGIKPDFEEAAQTNIGNFNDVFGGGLPKAKLTSINGLRASILDHEGETPGPNPMWVSLVNGDFETPAAYYEVSAWSVKQGNLDTLRSIVYSFREARANKKE
ncbi:MAG: hypothetical protein O9301_08515 [Leptospira sp.]|nr:hypothetical protein [Leptospira sp.]